MRRFVLGLFLTACIIAQPSVSCAGEPLVVFAATSLSDALKELAVDFKKEYKVDVVFNFGGSSALRLQIENGSPANVFLAADKKSVNALLSKNLVDGKSVVDLLSNRLVIVAAAKDTDKFTSLYDITLTKGDHLAIADPKTAPAGVYATQALTKADVYKKVEPYLVPAMDVRAALALVQSGNAKYAIVYATDALKAQDVKQVYVIPGQLYEPIVYSAAVIKNEMNIVPARNFLSFLQAEHSKMVFKKYGFQPFKS
ncbi:MAG: molybdate ABC transporter substrate-binding protein [Candidatus Omnitrophica bacterium]|nr:molybdate ABC transporter substrate-binding protein [Candidatus Omnitrophota bacterium]